MRPTGTDSQNKPYRILRYFRHTPGHLAGLFLVSIAIAGLQAANTYLMKIMYDTVYPRQDKQLLVLVCLALGGFILLVMGCNVLKQVILARIKNTLTAALRYSLLEEVTGFEFQYFVRRGSSAIMKRFVEDTEHIAEGMSRAVTGLSNIIVVVVWIIVFLFIVPWAALMYSALAGFLLAWVVVWRKPHQTSIHAISTAHERLYRLMWKAVAGIKTVKYERLNGPVQGALDDVMRDCRRAYSRQITISQVIWSVIHPLPWLAFVLVMFMGYGEIQAGHLTMGALTFCLWFTWRFVEPMAEMNTIVLALHQAVAAKRRIGELLTGKAESGGPLAFPGVADAVEFRGVSCRYEGNGFHLENVNLTLRRGRTMALIGRSGCGKSSLAHLLLRLYDPEAGAIYCDGTPIRDFTVASLRAGITLVPQDIRLFATTLRENIDIRGLLTDEEIKALLGNLMLHPCLERLPQGLDTVISGGGDFSGGEIQRLGLARALALRSNIYIFDEITANIDPETERQVLDAIFSRRDEMVALFITHNLNLLAKMDEVALIANNTVRLLEPHEKERGIERVLALYDIEIRSPVRPAPVPGRSNFIGDEAGGDEVLEESYRLDGA